MNSCKNVKFWQFLTNFNFKTSIKEKHTPYKTVCMFAYKKKTHAHHIFLSNSISSCCMVTNQTSLVPLCLLHDFSKKNLKGWKMNLQSPLSNLADINFESNSSPLRWKCSHTANTAEKSSTPGLQPSAAFSSLFWFTGPSGWGPAALTGPGIKSHGQLPAHELRQAAYYTCA